MLHKMPLLLVAIIIAIIFLEPMLPLGLKAVIYAVSLTIKSFIGFFLPFIIFGLLFKAAVSMAGNATKLVVLILFGVCGSNFISTFLSHYVGVIIYNFDMSIVLPEGTDGLLPAWTIEVPQLVPNNIAMLLGIVLGSLAMALKREIAEPIADNLDRMVSVLLNFLVFLIPLFILGFVTKLQADNIMTLILQNYAGIFAIIALAQFSYLVILYIIANSFDIKSMIVSIKNMLPAAIAGFSSMSSASALPLTIIGVNNNSQNKELAKSVVPVTANIHLIGDCFAIPIFAYALLKNYNIAEPDMVNYLTFTFYFVIAKFSVAAIPGGGIIVMLPILENYLGFNSDMSMLITSLYVLFDPVITSVNVLGNGAFAKIIDRVWGKRAEA